jgi:hypothetical protein
MTDAPTAPAMPTLADPGELGPSIAPAAPSAAPKPTEHAQSYEQRRLAQDQATAKPSDEAPVDPQAPQAPAPGEKVKIGKYEVSEDDLAGMMERQAQEDLRKATLPAAPEAYKAELPADLKLPGGVEYKFDQSNPSLVAARNWAYAKGLSQDEFSQVLGIYASHEAQQNAVLAERSRQEVAKAGVNAPQRVDAVGKWITGEMGEVDARPIRATIVTDAHLRFYEKMMNKISSQGAASFSQSHRAAPDTNPIPGYEGMSFEQRRYAQDQNAARRR